MITLFIFSFLLPVLLSLLITPAVIKFANKVGATDVPDDRKIHTTVMPRIGGLAIFISSVVSIAAVFFVFPDLFENIYEFNVTTVILAFSLVALFVLGFWDDLTPLSPEIKFGVQVLLAGILYFAGFSISNISNPLGEGMLNVQIIAFPLTILWIVGITNAFNLIDGLDGLASGVATITSISIFTISVISGQIGTAILSLVIAGALVGFLRYNFNPAKIFLGDSGSLIIGFSLALLSIESTSKITTGFALLFPFLVLVLPITDTIVSMIRRLIGSMLDKNYDDKPWTLLRRLYGMFTPDRSHIHHRLLSMGLSHRNAVLVLYTVSIFFAFSAFLFTQIDTAQTSITITITLGAVLFLCIKKLQYHEMAILHNGVMLSFFNKWILNRKSLIGLADMFFITISYALSYALLHTVNPGSIESANFTVTLAYIFATQLITFWATGLYRERLDQFSVGNTLHITSSVVYSAGATALVCYFIGAFPLIQAIQFIIFDFYFLLTFTLGFRTAYQALNFWFSKNKKSGENILIYGADENGSMLLQKIINSPDNNTKVIGFLDDDPKLEGKLFYGYPILGGYWNLRKTHLSHKVDSVFVCDEDIKPENLKRLRDKSLREGIAMKKLIVSLHDFETTDIEKAVMDI